MTRITSKRHVPNSVQGGDASSKVPGYRATRLTLAAAVLCAGPVVTLILPTLILGFLSPVFFNPRNFGVPVDVGFIGHESIGWSPKSAFAVVGIAVLFLVMRFVVWGRWTYAVDGNPETARRKGISVRIVLISICVISGIATGIDGGQLLSAVKQNNLTHRNAIDAAHWA